MEQGHMTKYALITKMGAGNSRTEWADSQGKYHSGFLRSVALEDASGKSFNITLGHVGIPDETFHIRTID